MSSFSSSPPQLSSVSPSGEAAKALIGCVSGPMSVLDFWFGGHWGTAAMDSGPLRSQLPLWWGIKSDFSGPITSEERAQIDASCAPFAAAVRVAGKPGSLHALQPDAGWDTSSTGRFAQVILTDQLSRNCFRGTAEAFATDVRANQLVTHLCDHDAACETLPLEAVAFLAAPGQHSENIADHDRNYAILEAMEARFGEEGERGTIKQLRDYVGDHAAVVRRFGRYPHRNAVLGRNNTEEETAWLADVDNLPGWAKSQQAKS